ncbi:MAG: FHA domain-containing protein [Actinobacteria bacterium]|nr:FHA domain-containing protein [Actinomycetota bacterium]
MADVFCNRCGHRNPPESRFCSSCGAPLDASVEDRPTITYQLDTPTEANEAIEVDLGEVPSGGMLVVHSGPNAGSRFAVDQDTITVGRHPESDIFLDDITVSRRHVEIVRQGDAFVVRDVGSLNGTYVNRQRIDETTLHDGDELQVGKFKLLYVGGGAAGSAGSA